MVRITTLSVVALMASSASGFAPASLHTSFSSTTELGLNRRDAMNTVGLAIGGILTGAFAPEASNAVSNPAL